MFVPAMLAVSALATLLFGFVGMDSLSDPLPLDRESLVRHALLGGGGCLLLVLAQTWVALFLFGAGRALEKSAAGLAPAAPRPEWLDGARQARRRVLPWVLAAPLSALAVFLLGGGVFSGLAPSWAHGLAFGASLALQLAALWREWRELSRHEAAFVLADRGSNR